MFLSLFFRRGNLFGWRRVCSAVVPLGAHPQKARHTWRRQANCEHEQWRIYKNCVPFSAVSLYRIALCLDGQSRFCNNTNHLLGKEATKRRHLRRMGYEVVQVGFRKCYEYDKIPLTWLYKCERGRQSLFVFCFLKLCWRRGKGLYNIGNMEKPKMHCALLPSDPILWIWEAEEPKGSGGISSQQNLPHHLQVQPQALITFCENLSLQIIHWFFTGKDERSAVKERIYCTFIWVY